MFQNLENSNINTKNIISFFTTMHLVSPRVLELKRNDWLLSVGVRIRLKLF